MQNLTFPRKIWLVISPLLLFLCISLISYTIAFSPRLIIDTLSAISTSPLRELPSTFTTLMGLISSAISLILCYKYYLPLWRDTQNKTPQYTQKAKSFTTVASVIVAFFGINLIIVYIYTSTGLFYRFSYEKHMAFNAVDNIIHIMPESLLSRITASQFFIVGAALTFIGTYLLWKQPAAALAASPPPEDQPGIFHHLV